MISFLNENAGFIQLIFAGLVAFATVVYAFLTAKMWKEMRQTNERLDRPNIVAILEPGRRWAQLFEFAIKNDGNISVYDVRVEVEPGDIIGINEKQIREISIFNSVIPVFIPQMEFRTKLFLYHELVAVRGDAIDFVFRVSFKSVDGVDHEQSYHYCTDIYKGLTVFNEGNLEDATKELKGIRSELKALSKNLSRNQRL